jgi:hypothetical protein
MSTKGVTERELKMLTGEGIHLGCLAVFLGCALHDASAPWWKGGSSVEPGSTSLASGTQAGGEKGPVGPKRRRRLGPVKSAT